MASIFTKHRISPSPEILLFTYIAVTLLCCNSAVSQRLNKRGRDSCTRLLVPPANTPPEIPNSSRTAQNETNDPETKLGAILSQGMDFLPFHRHNKSAILILGNTGSGKTTLSLTINGDLNRIHAVRSSSGRLVIIDDDQKIGLPSTKSKTLVPDYIVNGNNSVAFYDCPGFDDNRGPEMDIAAMYFVKSITEHLTKAKFLFTVTHSSVKIGNDRNDFGTLVAHITRFLRNMDHMTNSMGLIVTKVQSFNSFGEYLNDEEIIEEIVEFLSNFLNTLQEAAQNPENDDMHRRKIQFVKALLFQISDGEQILQTLNENYFLHLNQTFSANEIEAVKNLQETYRNIQTFYGAVETQNIQNREPPFIQLENLKNLTFNELSSQTSGDNLLLTQFESNLEKLLNFTGANREIFRPSFIPVFRQSMLVPFEHQRSKLLSKIENQIVPKWLSQIKMLATEATDEFFSSYVTEFEALMMSKNEGSRDAVEKLEKDRQFLEEISIKYNYKDDHDHDFTNIQTTLNNVFSQLSFFHPVMNGMGALEKQLHILINISGANVPQNAKANITFDAMLHFRNKFEAFHNSRHTKIQNIFIPRLHTEIDTTAIELLKNLETIYFQSVYQKFPIAKPYVGNYYSEFNSKYNSVSLIKQQRPSEDIWLIAAALGITHRSSKTSGMRKLEDLEEVADFYRNITGKVDSPTWNITGPINQRLEIAKNWYDYLKTLENILGNYNTQTLWNIHLTQLTIANLVGFDGLRKLQSYGLIGVTTYLDRNVIWNQLSTNDIQMLTAVMQYFVPTDLNIICDDRNNRGGVKEVKVRGKFVRFTDLFRNGYTRHCYQGHDGKHDSLQINASDTIYIDISLPEKFLDVKLQAPRWVVVGRSRYINLTGDNGVFYSSDGPFKKAWDGIRYGGNGSNGEDGRNGGNFNGFYGTIENAGELWVITSGGHGGHGQDGGDGDSGKSGKAAGFDDLPSQATKQKSKGENGEDIVLGIPESMFNKKGTFTLHGQMGSTGGRGGNGGNGGKGGAAGQLKFIPQNCPTRDHENVRTETNRGKNGVPGKGGKRGLGGFNGNDYKCNRQAKHIFPPFPDNFDVYCELIIVWTRSIKGEDGRDGDYY